MTTLVQRNALRSIPTSGFKDPGAFFAGEAESVCLYNNHIINKNFAVNAKALSPMSASHRLEFR